METDYDEDFDTSTIPEESPLYFFSFQFISHPEFIVK